MPTGPDPGEDGGVVRQGDARELCDGSTPQGGATLDETGHRGQLTMIGEVEQVPAVGPVPEDPDDRPGLSPLEVCRERASVERPPLPVDEVRLGDTGEQCQGRAHINEPSVLVDDPP